jgi:benzoyl-CoA reductase/2-hydroxyglutaryl-CoA dehydratase subunit BcrC/BadD/HgdB
MEEDMPNFDALVTTKELAKKMGLCAARIRRLAKSGDIPYLYVSERKFLFDPVKVYRAMEKLGERAASKGAAAEAPLHPAASAMAPPLPAAPPAVSSRPPANPWGKPNPRRGDL